jgi:ATP synthase protein I
MTGQEPPPKPHGDDDGPTPPNQGVGMTALSYLIAGILVWGLIGLVVDRWLGTGGIATGVGVVLGAAGAVYLIARRFGA